MKESKGKAAKSMVEIEIFYNVVPSSRELIYKYSRKTLVGLTITNVFEAAAINRKEELIIAESMPPKNTVNNTKKNSKNKMNESCGKNIKSYTFAILYLCIF